MKELIHRLLFPSLHREVSFLRNHVKKVEEGLQREKAISESIEGRMKRGLSASYEWSQKSRNKNERDVGLEIFRALTK